MNDQNKPQFQDLEWIIPKIIRDFSRNPNKRISATFRFFRNHPHLSLVGDYPILATITHTVLSLGITLTRNEVLYAFNFSDELKHLPRNEKTKLLDQLLTYPTGEIKQGKNASKKDLFSKDDALLVQTKLL